LNKAAVAPSSQENYVLAAMFNLFVRLLHFDEDGWVDEFDVHDPLAS
jgi:hypothetical protein